MIVLGETPAMLGRLKLTPIGKVGRSMLLGSRVGYPQIDREDERYGTVDKGISRHTTKVRQASCAEMASRKRQNCGMRIRLECHRPGGFPQT